MVLPSVNIPLSMMGFLHWGTLVWTEGEKVKILITSIAAITSVKTHCQKYYFLKHLTIQTGSHDQKWYDYETLKVNSWPKGLKLLSNQCRNNCSTKIWYTSVWYVAIWYGSISSICRDKKKIKRGGYCDSKRHNTCMCWMKLMISVDIILMTFRRQIKSKQNSV